jgi:hypothetical protein
VLLAAAAPVVEPGVPQDVVVALGVVKGQPVPVQGLGGDGVEVEAADPRRRVLQVRSVKKKIVIITIQHSIQVNYMYSTNNFQM